MDAFSSVETDVGAARLLSAEVARHARALRHHLATRSGQVRCQVRSGDRSGVRSGGRSGQVAGQVRCQVRSGVRSGVGSGLIRCQIR